jgi:FKBP-type peptidyl-prolyl cis-trans isomerase
MKMLKKLAIHSTGLAVLFGGAWLSALSPTPEKTATQAGTFLLSTSFESESLSAGDDQGTSDTLSVTKTPSGITCVVTKPATGRQPKPGEIVVLRLTSLLESGKEFRSPQGGSEADWVWLQPEKQPKGLIEGLSLLHVGESAVLVIPPELGYGAKGGRGGAVPPNAVLVYFVDVLDVKSDDIASMMQNSIDANGIDDAIKQYEDLKSRGFPDIHVNEENMSRLGYKMIRLGRLDAAIKIFQLNVEAYPQSANAYDSLGEAYAASGDKQRAINNYQKALSIDPKQESSLSALKKLKSN